MLGSLVYCCGEDSYRDNSQAFKEGCWLHETRVSFEVRGEVWENPGPQKDCWSIVPLCQPGGLKKNPEALRKTLHSSMGEIHCRAAMGARYTKTAPVWRRSTARRRLGGGWFGAD